MLSDALAIRLADSKGIASYSPIAAHCCLKTEFFARIRSILPEMHSGICPPIVHDCATKTTHILLISC